MQIASDVGMKAHDDLGIGALCDVVELLAELVIIVANQETRSVIVGRIAELLRCALLGRSVRHGLVDDFSRIVFDDYEGEDLTKARIVGLEKIAGPNLMGMVSQEG